MPHGDEAVAELDSALRPEVAGLPLTTHEPISFGNGAQRLSRKMRK
jgi:hypothetical protein